MIDDNAVLNGTLSEMRTDIKGLQGSMEGDNGIRVRLATLEATVGSNATVSGERHTATQGKIESLEGKVDALGGKVGTFAKDIGAKVDALAAAKTKPFNLLDYVDAKTIAVIIAAIASLLGIGGLGIGHATAQSDPPPAITTGGAP